MSTTPITNPTGAATKALLLAIGARVLARDAFATLADIGREAVMRKSVIHYHFADKQSFVRAVYEHACAAGTATPALHAAMVVLAQRDAHLERLVRAHAPATLRTDEILPAAAAAVAAE